jgi:phage shock protein E
MRNRKTLAAGLLASAALTVAACSSGEDSVATIDAPGLVDVIESGEAVVIDVRTPGEYAAGHVPGALNIDVQSPSFGDEIAELPTDETYVVYCRSGNRSADATAQMADAGFIDLYNVDAGLATLAEAGVPLTQ